MNNEGYFYGFLLLAQTQEAMYATLNQKQCVHYEEVS